MSGTPDAVGDVATPASSVGGQAVIEGVMIRSPHAWAVAVRRPDGDIETETHDLPRLSARSKWAKVPFIRGVLVLGESLTLGFKALTWSADKAAEGEAENERVRLEGIIESARGPLAGLRRKRAGKRLENPGEISRGEMGIAMFGALVVFVGVFMLLPLGGAKLAEEAAGGENVLVFTVAEGVIRVLLFVGYIWAIGRSKEIARVFQYHGAEHKSIWAYEAGDPLDVESVQKYQTMHPRCGTSFLIIVVLLAVLVFTLLGLTEPPLWWTISSRVVLVPVIAGIAYELLKASATASWLHALSWPGIQLQRITTKEPDDAMVEVAISSLLASLTQPEVDEVKERGNVCEPALRATHHG